MLEEAEHGELRCAEKVSFGETRVRVDWDCGGRVPEFDTQNDGLERS